MKAAVVACMIVFLSSQAITHAQSDHPVQIARNAGPDIVARVTRVKGLKLVAGS